MDQLQSSLGRPASLRRNRTLQMTPTLASLLCEMRVQCPDLLAPTGPVWEIAMLTDAVFADVDGRERVAGEYGDKMLARRVGKSIEVYSPFLGRAVPAMRREVTFLASPVATTTAATPPRKTIPRRRASRKAAVAA